MKWITVKGRDREGKGLHYLIHGAYDLKEGDRVLVFPSADRRIPYSAAKGLGISPGARVVAVPHTKMPWSRITTSIFANDALPPTANFEVDATLGYQPFEVSFTDLSYANPPATAWLWDFGDGTTSEEQHPSHTYPGIGWYTVSLTVTNGIGSDALRREALIYSGVDYPVDLEAWRSSDTTATIAWIPGANNQQVVIARRHDFYPPHPNNAARIYQGAPGGGPITDSGLDPGQEYYYRIWGIRNGILSEGYRSATLKAEPVYQSDPVHVCEAWDRLTAYTGEVVSYGPFPYYWDGRGDVYLSSSPTEAAEISIDDGPVATTPYGTIDNATGQVVWRGIMSLTSILRPGQNLITIEIRDTTPVRIGAYTPLYIMRAL